MTTASYIRTNTFIQYDGANGAEIAALMGRTILSDTGTVLTFVPSPPLTFTDVFHLGDAFSPRAGFFLKADFEAQYVSAFSMTPVKDTVGVMDAVTVPVPILLLGGSVERVITWNRAFPNNKYAVTYLPDANTIGKITLSIKVVNGQEVKSASGLTIVLTAGLAVSVAGVLHVIGSTQANADGTPKT